MALEIDGKVIKVLEEISGEGRNGTWKKQAFVVETMGEYPKKICFQAWGNQVDSVKSINDGDRVIVNFRLESREFNEKWYTDATAWRIQKLGDAGGASNTQAPVAKVETAVEPPLPENKEEDDLPF